MQHLKRFSSAAFLWVLSLMFSGAAHAQNVSKDLQSVLALQGKPCGQVTAAIKQGADHYIAKCSNGKRYRVKADSNGRVVVTLL